MRKLKSKVENVTLRGRGGAAAWYCPKLPSPLGAPGAHLRDGNPALRRAVRGTRVVRGPGSPSHLGGGDSDTKAYLLTTLPNTPEESKGQGEGSGAAS